MLAPVAAPGTKPLRGVWNPLAAGTFHVMSAGGEQVLWSRSVAFDEDGFADRCRFPDIVRTVKPLRGRKGLTGGRLQMKTDGIHWEAGSLGTPAGQIDGTFLLPWSVITSIEVRRIPHNLPVGGALFIHLQGGPQLYGEFLGSLKRLQEAINRSPAGTGD